VIDARQAKTRLALDGALHRLLASTPLDTITVSQLCREAGVHRTTFYAHAPTVYAFAIDEFTRRLDQISSVSVAAAETDTDEIAERYFESLVQSVPTRRAAAAASASSPSAHVSITLTNPPAMNALASARDCSVWGMPGTSRAPHTSIASIARWRRRSVSTERNAPRTEAPKSAR
jgi:AcrR family transcriptional regulator